MFFSFLGLQMSSCALPRRPTVWVAPNNKYSCHHRLCFSNQWYKSSLMQYACSCILQWSTPMVTNVATSVFPLSLIKSHKRASGPSGQVSSVLSCTANTGVRLRLCAILASFSFLWWAATGDSAANSSGLWAATSHAPMPPIDKPVKYIRRWSRHSKTRKAWMSSMTHWLGESRQVHSHRGVITMKVRAANCMPGVFSEFLLWVKNVPPPVPCM